jgi:integrase
MPGTKAGIADLHFHDLRHQWASRLRESGWQRHQVKEMLGRANINQTNTYVNAGRIELQDAMRRLDVSRCSPVANESEQAPPLDRNDDEQPASKSLVN